VGNHLTSYVLVFRLLSFFVDCLCFRWALHVLPNSRIAPYIVATFAVGDLIYHRIDVVLLLGLFLVLRSLKKGAYLTVAGLLGLGFSFKVIPALVFPALGARLFREGHSRRFMAATVGLFSGAAGLPFLVATLLCGWGTLTMFEYHAARGLQIESVWSNIQLLWAGASTPEFVTLAYGSHNTTTPFSSILLKLSLLSGGLVLAASIFLACVRSAPLDQIFAWTIPAFIAVGKVLSPQFLVFCAPLMLVLERGRAWYGWLVALLCGLTLLEFNLLYRGILEGRWSAIAVLTARNALFLSLLGYSLVQLLTSEPERHEQEEAGSPRLTEDRLGL
jgi:hypothetical protein